MRQINLNRQLLGLEDILFGTGTVTQTRGGQLATVTKVNAGNLPFDETRTLIQWAQSVNVEALGSMVTELQAIYNNLAIISNIDNNLDLLNIINSNIAVLQELHTNLSILQNIDSNIAIITDINTNLDILTSIYNNLSALVNIHTNLTSLLAIDTNMQQLLNINTNLPELLSINTTIVPNITELLDVNNKAEQVALDKQAVESLASQVTIDKQDVNTMKLAVETIYDTFDDRFLGAKDADPLVDNDGNALLDGALYFNTISNALKVYALDITTWVTIPQIYLSSLLDVQLTSITTNSILTWNGTKWVNTTTPVFDSVKLTGTNYGVMSWNTNEQVPSITLNSDVDIDLGESLILVKNTTGSTILDGKVVMAIGSNGNSGNILVSLHSGLKTDAKRTIGIATQNILNGSTGFVTKEGKVNGINTTGSTYGETWVNGDILYVKANGGLTKVEPLDSQLKMPIAFVIHAHTSGTIYVRTLGIDENYDRDLISTKLDASEYTATDILTKLKTVDGSGSGLEADTATKLSAVRTIALTGDVEGSVSFDGSVNVSITTTVADDSHNHIISNVDGLQDALDSKADTSYVNNKYSGFKNYIINGNFDVWQRGTSFSSVGYTADRWHLAIGGSANATKHNILPNTILLATTADSSFANLYQAIETATVVGLRGKTLTLSLKIAVGGTHTGGLVLSAKYSNSTDILDSQNTTIQSIGISAGSANTRYSLTFTVPADAVGLIVNIENTVAQASGALYQVQEVQLEEGSVATPFEQRPIGLELSLCQRYYLLGNGVIKKHSASEKHAGTQPLYILYDMRVTPTISVSKSGVQTGANALAFTAGSRGLLIWGGIDYNTSSIGDFTIFNFIASAEL